MKTEATWGCINPWNMTIFEYWLSKAKNTLLLQYLWFSIYLGQSSFSLEIIILNKLFESSEGSNENYCWNTELLSKSNIQQWSRHLRPIDKGLVVGVRKFYYNLNRDEVLSRRTRRYNHYILIPSFIRLFHLKIEIQSSIRDNRKSIWMCFMFDPRPIKLFPQSDTPRW